MTKKQLKRKIEKQLDQLSQFLDKIDEAQIINSDDPETWDFDALYDLIENLKKALKLLEDQRIKDHQFDEFGQPLYEEGLCSLVDSYQEEDEDYE